MTIQQLEYTLTVDQFRHFAKAAEYCRVTQPTLSAVIQKLEDELGVKLFDHSMTPVCPTSIGKRVLGQTRKILSGTTCVKEIINKEQHSLSGTFRLAVLPTTIPCLSPRFLPQLMEKYPDFDIRVVEMKTPNVRKTLLTSEAGAAIIASLLDGTALTEEISFYEQPFGYIPKKEPLFKHDVIRTSGVTEKRLWLLDEGHCSRDQLVRFCRVEAVKVSRMAYHLDNIETFMHMMEGGKGITLIPELAVMQLNEEQEELVRPLAIPRPTRQIVLVTRRDFIRTDLLQVLKEEIQAAILKEMLTLQAVRRLI